MKKRNSGLEVLYIKVAILSLVACLLSGCANLSSTNNPGWPSNIDFKPGVSLIKQVNDIAGKDASWFTPLDNQRLKVESKYTGNQRDIAPYLEGDVYIHNDPELAKYLTEVLSSLTSVFDGPKPQVSIFVETNTRFSAYVDVLGQIHLTTGLLRSLENEDQLAGILAHELSHFLLRHNLEKQATVDVSDIAGYVGAIGQELARSPILGIGTADRQKLQSRMMIGVDSFGLIWSDLMAPKWSRENESEADRLAVDIMKLSGYNDEELITAIAMIHDASDNRSSRIQKIGDVASGFIAAYKKDAYEWSDKDLGEIVGDSGAMLATALADRGLDNLTDASRSHAGKTARIKSLKGYINDTYSAFDLPPEIRKKRFLEVVSSDAEGGKLQQDLAAVETLIAVGKRNLQAARQRYASIRYEDDDQIQVSTALAQMSMEVANRNYDAALARLSHLAEHKYAPAEVYIKLAKLQARKRDYIGAEKTLDKGSAKIGRRYRFLPTFVKLYKANRNTDAAIRTVLECADYDSGQWIDALGLITGVTHSQPDSYYSQCTSILGYDVKKKRLAENRQKLIDSAEKGREIFKDLFGR